MTLVAADAGNHVGWVTQAIDESLTSISCNLKLLDNQGMIGGTMLAPQGTPLAGVNLRLPRHSSEEFKTQPLRCVVKRGINASNVRCVRGSKPRETTKRSRLGL